MAHHPEVILISSVIQTADIYPAEEAGLRSDHFHAYRTVWEWLEDYIAKYRKVPSKSVFRSEHPDFPLLRANDVAWAARDVRRNHMQQTLSRAVTDAVEHLKREEVDECLMVLAPVVARLERDFDGGKTLDASDDAEEIYARVRDVVDRNDRDGLPGVPTGFPTLDEITGGFQPGHYWTLAARLGHGKSWIATRMAVEAAREGKTVLFHSLEMSRLQVALRTHTFYARYTGHKFTNRQLNTGRSLDLIDYQDFLEGLPEKVPGHVKIFDRSRGKVTPFSISANIERYQPDLVIVDYIQLMSTGSKGKSSDWESLSQVSGELQALAQESAVPIIALSQVNREGSGGKRPPSVDQLARADSIGQDSDGVLTLKQWSPRTLQMRLAKFRHGAASQMWWTEYDPDHGRIDEITYEDALDLQLEDEEDDEE